MIETMNTSRNDRPFLGTERGQPQRSGGEPNGVPKNDAPTSSPNPEVLAKPKRRRFTAAYKASIVEQAEKCTEPGQIGALLRREGLYSSALTLWRQQYKSGAIKGLKDQKRGRKRVRDPKDLELDRLRRQNQQLQKKLHKAELIIDIQKKISEALGIPNQTTVNGEENS